VLSLATTPDCEISAGWRKCTIAGRTNRGPLGSHGHKAYHMVRRSDRNSCKRVETDSLLHTRRGGALYIQKNHSETYLWTKCAHVRFPLKLTAASRQLPLGSLARVTSLRNKKAVVVTITDRGPYAKHRVIDLSTAAARRIGMIRHGVDRVRVEPLRGSRAQRSIPRKGRKSCK